MKGILNILRPKIGSTCFRYKSNSIANTQYPTVAKLHETPSKEIPATGMDGNSSSTGLMTESGTPLTGSSLASSPLTSHAIKLRAQLDDLLGILDRLCIRGLGRPMELPSIVVCGDRSSGKSTLLSALTGIQFSVNEALFTRFIFELVLCRDSTVSASVKIIPGCERSEEERLALSAFRRYPRDLDISNIIKEAEEIIRLNTTGRFFCGDALRIEITGPTQPHLTLVDLPGLFPAENNGGFKRDAKCIEEAMVNYIESQTTIILAVVSAERDFANQQVISHVRVSDPLGTRTLGIITKADTLKAGSENEDIYINVAQNNCLPFRLEPIHWHVLSNCSRATNEGSATEQDRAETDFFTTGPWQRFDASRCGIKALRTRVGDMLYDIVKSELPGALNEVQVAIQDCEQRLLRLGSSRDTIDEKRQYLFRVSASFCGLLKAAVDGWYTDPFFTDSAIGTHSRQLRAVIQNKLSAFAMRIREQGQAQIIQDDELPGTLESRRIPRTQYMEEVTELMQRFRGHELPGTYHPLIVSELFRRQSKPWEGLIRELGHSVMCYVESVVNEALVYVSDDDIASKISCLVVGPHLQELRGALQGKLDELLQPHLLGHPITYNPSLMESVRNAQAARSRVSIKTLLENFFGDLYGEEGNGGVVFDMEALRDSLVKDRELDMVTYPCTMAIDTADAYYKIALEKIIDDVSVLAIERCLIQKLPDLFSVHIISHLEDDEIHSIASENNASATERALVTEKLTVLRESLTELTRF